MVGRTRPRRAAARRLSPRMSGEVAQEEEGEEATAAEVASDAATEPPSTRRSTRIRRSQRGGGTTTTTTTTTRETASEPTKKRTRSSAQSQKRSEKETGSGQSNAENEEDKEEDDTASKISDSVKETESKEESEEGNGSDEVSPVMRTRRREKVDKETSEARGSNDDTTDEKNGSQSTDLNKGDDREGGNETDNVEEKKRTAINTDGNNEDDKKKSRSEKDEKITSNEEAPPWKKNAAQDNKADAEFYEKKDEKSSQEHPKEEESQSGGQSLIHVDSGEKDEVDATAKGEEQIAAFRAERKDETVAQSRTDNDNAKTGKTVKSSDNTAKSKTTGEELGPGSKNPPAAEWDKSMNGEDRSELPGQKQQQISSKQIDGHRDDSALSKQSGGDAAVSNDNGNAKSSTEGRENVDITSKPQTLTTIDHALIEVETESVLHDQNICTTKVGSTGQETAISCPVNEIRMNEPESVKPEVEENLAVSEGQDSSQLVSKPIERDPLKLKAETQSKSIPRESNLVLQRPALVSISTVGTVESQPSEGTVSHSIADVKKGASAGEKRTLDTNANELNKRQKIEHGAEPKDWSEKTKVQQPAVQMADLNRIKVMLFSFGKRAHSSQGYERLFSEYWNAVSLLIDGRIPQSAATRSRANIKNFLKTKTLRKLHNRLISGLLERCTASVVPRHSIKADEVPASIKNRIRLHSRIMNEGHLKDVDHGDYLIEPVGLQPYTTITSAQNANEKKRPKPLASSSVLPGALIVDPHVRMVAQKAGLNVSENAVWLLVVAMKEYSSAILKNAVSTAHSLEKDGPLPPPSIQPQLLGKRDYTHPQANTTPEQSSDEKKCITSHHMHALTAGMQMAAPYSLGGCSSRLTFETSLFGAFDNSIVADSTAFADLHAFLASAFSPSPKRIKVEDQESIAATDGAVPIENPDQAEFSSIGSFQTRTGTPGSVERERSPFGGLGRGAKDLASLKARSSILQKNMPLGSIAPDSGEIGDVSSKMENEHGSNEFEASGTTGALPSDVAVSAASIADTAVLGGGTLQEPTANPAQVQHVAVSRKGKGAGVKNLAAMRARSLTIKPAEEEEEKFRSEGQGGETLDSSMPRAEPESSLAKVSMTAPNTGPQSFAKMKTSAESNAPMVGAETERSHQSIPAIGTHSGGSVSVDSAVQGAENNEAALRLASDLSPVQSKDHTSAEATGDHFHSASKQIQADASSASDQPRKAADASPANPPFKSVVGASTDAQGTTEEEKPAIGSSTISTWTDEQAKKPVVNPTTTTQAKVTAVESPTGSPPTKPESKSSVQPSFSDTSSSLLAKKPGPMSESKAEQKSDETGFYLQPPVGNVAKTQRTANTAEEESDLPLAEPKDQNAQSDPVTAKTD